MKLEIKNLDIYFEIIGEGKPIIMLHGFYPDHRLMKGCMEPIFKNRRNYKRIYLDLPGMGMTKAKSWITNADIMLDILIDFIEKISPHENFLIAAESYGGYLARGIIKRMPKRINGVLLICPCIIANKKKRIIPTHLILEYNNIPYHNASAKDIDEYASMAVVQNIETWKRYQQEILCGLKIADNAFLTDFEKNGYEFSFDVDILDEKFESPTLFLLGRQDSCIGYKDAWRILDNYPRGTFVVLDKAGHNLQIEQDGLFNSLVHDWLDRVESMDI